MNSSITSGFNTELLEEKFYQWLDDPTKVDSTWVAFFEGFSLGMSQSEIPSTNTPPSNLDRSKLSASDDQLRVTQTDPVFRARVVSLLYNYRALGHTEAWVDPLSISPPEDSKLSYETFGFTSKDLNEQVASQFFLDGKPMPLEKMIQKLRHIYCGGVGFEYMGIHDSSIRHWLRDRIERRPDYNQVDLPKKIQILNWLTEAEEFENYLHKKFVAQKRFGLEGGESTIVALNTLLYQSSEEGVEEIVMGMAHRGRLNVLANFLKKPLSVLFNEFSENYVPNLVCGDGDVPQDVVDKEKLIEMGRDDLANKPEQIREKIVEGRIAKRLKELVLLDQPYIKDSALTVEQLVKQTAGKIGENIKVRRFTRYTLGEGIEVKEVGFAEEVESMKSI